jgi:hypothetical protein
MKISETLERIEQYLTRTRLDESNYAFKYQVDAVNDKISVLQDILIETGLLVKSSGKVKETVYVIDGALYEARKGDK